MEYKFCFFTLLLFISLYHIYKNKSILFLPFTYKVKKQLGRFLCDYTTYVIMILSL